jgi:dihydrofolate reductase
VKVVSSVEAALTLAKEIALIDGTQELMVIGGAGIYAAAIPLAHRMYITEVHSSVEGDAYLPEIDWQQWREMSREHHCAAEANMYDFSFVVYERC